ncbi:PREDICTED: cytochrome P450 CYP72A219-like [Prunus mume]|uniref:Cytochrome P450 CYP72A219-like n=1 Tax=Prunus mume TaxID=102107 RepID=A0ABM0NKW6_PRUMU|nr:PREDICTED: cytochrome P450 CYP72A219-like [Prunus mume]
MVVAILCVGLITLGWKVVNWVWLKPKKLERYLRQQGLSGNSYRLLIGDLTDNSKMTKEALSKPMEFSHDIVPYVLPLLQETFNKYGKKSFIWLGPVPSVVIFDAELMRETLTKHRVFEKPHSNPLLSFLVTGLLSYEGDKWVKHKRIINPAFHIDKMKDMLPAFHAACENMLSKWETHFSSKETCELDVWPYLCAFSGDAISRAAFGSNFEEGERFFELQKEQGALTREVLNSVYIPLLRFLPTKMNRSMKQISDEMAICLRGIINKREKAMRAGEATEDDLLGILLKSNFSEIQEHGDDKDVGMSIEEVIEECKVFYLAGEDTTKDLINWTLVLLGKHQDWQRRAREEVVQIFKNKQPDHAGLNRLKIVNMILYEVLRLYPPAIFTIREITKETKLGDISLPPGVQLAVPILFVHHDKEIWGDDVHEFKPERFSEGISKASKNEVAPFFSFSTGPRTCIGQNFALMEAKTVITMILQRFTFELSPAYRHSPLNMLTLEPQYGTQIIFHKI